MIKIAICGNIASGKSTVEAYLEDYGFKVFDTDKLSHNLLDELKSQINNAFSGFDILEDNEISRKKLGEIVFSDPEKRKLLESIIYPALKNRIVSIFDENSSEPAVFVSIPLLFEVGWQDLFDKIVFVKCDDEIRLKRLMLRNSLTEADAKARMAAQLPQEAKIEQSDFIICNNADTKSLQKEFKKFIIFLEDYGVKKCHHQ